jgi:hypothetical protein
MSITKLDGIVRDLRPYFSAALWSLSQTIANLAWFSFGLVDADGEDGDVAGGLVGDLLVLGEALLARVAERAPEVEDDDLALRRLQRLGPSPPTASAVISGACLPRRG